MKNSWLGRYLSCLMLIVALSTNIALADLIGDQVFAQTRYDDWNQSPNSTVVQMGTDDQIFLGTYTINIESKAIFLEISPANFTCSPECEFNGLDVYDLNAVGNSNARIVEVRIETNFPGFTDDRVTYGDDFVSFNFNNLVCPISDCENVYVNAYLTFKIPEDFFDVDDMQLDFSGRINLILGTGVEGINLNDPVSATLIYDTSISDNNTHVGVGYFPNAIKSIELTIGSKSFSLLRRPSTTTSEIAIENDYDFYGEYIDRIQFRATVLEAYDSPVYIIEFSFSTKTDTVSSWITTDEKLPSNIDLTAADQSAGHIRTDPFSASNSAYFNFDDITLSEITQVRSKAWRAIIPLILNQ